MQNLFFIIIIYLNNLHSFARNCRIKIDFARHYQSILFLFCTGWGIYFWRIKNLKVYSITFYAKIIARVNSVQILSIFPPKDLEKIWAPKYACAVFLKKNKKLIYNINSCKSIEYKYNKHNEIELLLLMSALLIQLLFTLSIILFLLQVKWVFFFLKKTAHAYFGARIFFSKSFGGKIVVL